MCIKIDCIEFEPTQIFTAECKRTKRFKIAINRCHTNVTHIRSEAFGVTFGGFNSWSRQFVDNFDTMIFISTIKGAISQFIKTLTRWTNEHKSSNGNHSQIASIQSLSMSKNIALPGTVASVVAIFIRVAWFKWIFRFFAIEWVFFVIICAYTKNATSFVATLSKLIAN